ncbi:hypothetical protein ABZ832_23490 [Streptantibioticus parmotrematis]|uniref:hypothetical protein n=1 Tax=Streptantibioticus parmotrematis TaxID=2873249 RepID=UPI0033F7C37D
MTRRTTRALAVTAAAVLMSAAGTAVAFAETPQPCDGGYVCLKSGTVFGAPASDYPAQSQPGAVSATQLVSDCNAALAGQEKNISCGFYPNGDGTPTQIGFGPWQQVTSDFLNCSGGTATESYSAAETYSESNSVTVGVSVESGIEDLFKTTVSTSYSYTWGSAQTTTQTYNETVDPGDKAHMAYRYEEQQLTGTLWINYGKTGNSPGQGYGHHYYAITGFTETSPVKQSDGSVQTEVTLVQSPAQPGECPS